MAITSFQPSNASGSSPESQPSHYFKNYFSFNLHLNNLEQVMDHKDRFFSNYIINESAKPKFTQDYTQFPNEPQLMTNLTDGKISKQIFPPPDQRNALKILQDTTANILNLYPSKTPYNTGSPNLLPTKEKTTYFNGFFNFSQKPTADNKENGSVCSSHSSSSGPASSNESEIGYNQIQNFDNKNTSFPTPHYLQSFSELPCKEQFSQVANPNSLSLSSTLPNRTRKQPFHAKELIEPRKRRKCRRANISSNFGEHNTLTNSQQLHGVSRPIDSQENRANIYFETHTNTQITESDSNNPSSYDDWNYRPAKGRPPRARSTFNSKPNDAFYIGRGLHTEKHTKSLRERNKNVNYAMLGAEFETEDEDKDQIIDSPSQEESNQYVPTVERILNHRINPESGQQEYFIKWKNQAYIHNSWESYENLKGAPGIKKVDNYIKRSQENEQRRSKMTADEIEQEDIALELQKQLDEDAMIAERIVEASTDPETNIPAYLVKWLSCPYDQCTWEIQDTLFKHKFDYLIDEYNSRQIRTRGENSLKSFWHTQSLSHTKFDPYTKTPFYMKGGDKKLRDYQLTGLNWMVSRMKHGLSVLLADEMGLGKTVQTISLIGHMIYTENLIGPYLVIVPQSTIDNWLREFHSWMPEINVVCLHGNAMGRDMLRFYELRQVTVPNKGTRWRFDVCITTPSILNSPVDIDFLRKIYWQLMAIDEAHQLKNRNSKRFQQLRLFQAEYKLLLSGTPLHNNLEEMWTLLHFTNPSRYINFDDFKRKYPDIENTSAIGEAKQIQLANLQAELHEVVLRRVKKDVEKSLPNKVESILKVEMSPYQEQWYENVFTRNYDQLAKSSGGARNSLQNICMELKKVCNHPFLCSPPQSASHYQSGIVQGSGKMCLLEKLLFRLKEKSHRVLIFSQMVKMLNLLSEYLTHKGLRHQRLDGSMGKEMRKKAMDHFNAPDSDDFAFLLSTKAGGLGINLTSADTVIIYDSDWNPQNDLQAEARAHRIGQTKTVQIYRLVTKNSIEQSILERAKSKMVLDTLVVQGLNKKHLSPNEMTFGISSNTSFTREELSRILRFGAQNLWKHHEISQGSLDRQVDVDLDKILEEAQVTTSETTDIADDLLSSFNNITEFRYEPSKEAFDNINDKDFWSSTIPLEERLKFRSIKDQELLVTGPRRTRAREIQYVKGVDDEEYLEEELEVVSDDNKRKLPKLKKKISDQFSEKDRYKLYRSLLKYGTTKARLLDIHEDSRLVNFDNKFIDNECQAIIELCQKRLLEIGYKTNHNHDDDDLSNLPQSVNEEPKTDGDTESNLKNGNLSKHFVAIGENKANAVDLVERVELLTMLDDYIKKQNPQCSEPWKLPSGLIPYPGRIKPPLPEFLDSPLILTLPDKVVKRLKEWTAKDVRNWGATEDINLIKGTYMYGFGAWTEVSSDPNLNLEQIRNIKYDKVKMRALRTLKLLHNAIDEAKNKNQKKFLKQENKSDSSLANPDQSVATPSPSLQSNDSSLSVSKAPRPKKYKRKDDDMKLSNSEILEKTKQEKVTPPIKDYSSFAEKDWMAVSEQDLKTYVKYLFKPLKKQLKRMKSLSEKNYPQTEIINRMRKLLPIFGDLISETIKPFQVNASPQIFYDACWNYVASFTALSSENLQILYLDLCNLRGEDESTPQHPNQTEYNKNDNTSG